MKYLLPVALALAGCASWHWERPGATDEDYRQDEILCKGVAYRGGSDGAVTQTHVRVMHACLESRGWRKAAR